MKSVLLMLILTVTSLTARAGKERDGGFDTRNAQLLLNFATQDLAQKIRQSPDNLWSFPENWNREKLAELIQNIRPLFEDERGITPSGFGDKKELSYVEGGSGQTHLVALKPFYDKYKWVPPNGKDQLIQDIRNNIEFDLLWEAAHAVWNYNEADAQAFAERTARLLSARIPPTKQVPVDLSDEPDDDLLLIDIPAKEISILIERPVKIGASGKFGQCQILLRDQEAAILGTRRLEGFYWDDDEGSGMTLGFQDPLITALLCREFNYRAATLRDLKSRLRGVARVVIARKVR